MKTTTLRCAIRAALVVLFALALSCASADEEIAPQSSNQQGAGKADETEQGDELEVPDGAEVLAENYALVIDTWLKTAEDDDDEPKEWRAQLRARLERYTSDATTDVVITPCSVILPEVDGRTVEMDSRGLRSVRSAPIRTSLIQTAAGIEFSTALGALVAGADLRDPVDDDMPSSDRDDRLVDIDDDGRPAMTITIDGFSVYVGLRYRFSLDGMLDVDQGAAGDASVRIDLEVYGDSVPFINIKNRLDEALGKLNLRDEKHAFLMQPLAPEDSNCESIAALDHVHTYAELSPSDD